jgi:transcription-repair coupling factor (superfamily II helicase)
VDKLSSAAPVEPEKEIKMDIPVDAFIPAEYVPDSAIRISFYQECSSCKEFTRIDVLEKNMLDRFGPLPLPVQTLLAIVHIRIYGRKISLSHIALTKENMLLFSFHGTDEEVGEKMQKILKGDSIRFEIGYGEPIMIKTGITSLIKLDKLQEIQNIFKKVLVLIQEG